LFQWTTLERRRLRFGSVRLNMAGVVIGLLVAIATLLVVTLLGFVVWTSFASIGGGFANRAFTLANYGAVFNDPIVVRAATNTLAFSAGTVVVAALFGLPLAWLAERTNLPGRSTIAALLTMTLLIPGFFTAMGWLLLFHPRIGVANQLLMHWFGLRNAPLPITNIFGMAWVEGLTLAPVFFIMAAGSFRATDPTFEEAASASGASALELLRRVTLPLMSPAIFAASIFVFTSSLGTFDIPGVIGLSNRILTFSTYLYLKTSGQNGVPDYGPPAAFGAVVICFAVLLGVVYIRLLARAREFQVVTGKAYHPRLVRLGPFVCLSWMFVGLYLTLAILLPLLIIIWSALLPYYQAPSMNALHLLSFASFSHVPWNLLARGFTNSLVISLVAPTLALVLSLAFSWTILRSKLRGRLLLDGVAFLPHAVPGVIFSLGAILVALFLLPKWIPLYGSVTIIIIVNVVAWLSFGTRMINSALIQISPELEEAAAVSGASGLETLRRILIPLLAPTIVSAWLWLVLLGLRELSRTVLLVTTDNVTLSVITWSLWTGGLINQSAVVVLATTAVLLPFMALYFYLANRAQLPASR
jgi:iron(III) transport system permease protein